MLHFRRTDTVGQTGERAVRRRMRVTTHDGHARQGRPIFRTNHMENAHARVFEREVGQGTDFANIGIQRFDLQTGHGVLDAFIPMIGRRVVIRG